MSPFRHGRWLTAGSFVLAFLFSTTSLCGEETLPPFSEIQKTVQAYFDKERGRREEDILSRSQAAEVLQEVKKLGWQVPDEKKILDDVLDDQHILVRTMRSAHGRKFLAKVASRELIFDRLDRISEVSGGPELIRDLVKLPDGEKYAKPRSGGGVPDLLDLLPKNASGKTRRISDYDAPTGHIYTAADLIARLEEEYSKSKPKSP